MPARPPRQPPRPEQRTWNGEFYANFGHDAARSWYEAIRYNFFSAGYGPRFTQPLYRLTEGCRIWVKAPGYGYVGVGRITSGPIRADTFKVDTPSGPRPALEVLREGTYHRQYVNSDRAEYFVSVRWLQAVALGDAVREPGMFGNQNTICRPRAANWETTVSRLKILFPTYDQ